MNPKIESPVGKGKILCASAFIGPEVDFGIKWYKYLGNGPRLLIDNFGQNSDLINIFKEYFEDANVMKVW